MGALILAALAIAMPQAHGVAFPISEVSAELVKRHYTAELNFSPYSMLSQEDCKLWVVLGVDDASPPKIAGVQFREAFVVKGRPSQSQLSEWMLMNDEDRTGIRFYVQVDGTVTARSFVEARKGSTAAQFVDEIEEHVRAYRAFCKDFQATLLPSWRRPTDPEIDYTRRLDTADEMDFAYLTSAWGWAYKGFQGGSLRGDCWAFPITIRDRLITLRNGVAGNHEPYASLAMETMIAKPAKDVAGWVVSANKMLKWGTVEDVGYQGLLTVRSSIDLRKGLTPKEIKSKIEEFLKNAEELEKEAIAGR